MLYMLHGGAIKKRRWWQRGPFKPKVYKHVWRKPDA